MASSVETAAIRRNFTQQREARMSHLKGQWQKEENNSSERSNYPHLCLLMGGRGEKKCFSKKKKKWPKKKWPILIVDCYQLSSYRRAHLAAAQH